MTRRSKQVLFFVGSVAVLTMLLQDMHHSLAMAAQGEMAGWWYGSAVLSAIAIVVVALLRPVLEPVAQPVEQRVEQRDRIRVTRNML